MAVHAAHGREVSHQDMTCRDTVEVTLASPGVLHVSLRDGGGGGGGSPPVSITLRAGTRRAACAARMTASHRGQVTTAGLRLAGFVNRHMPRLLAIMALYGECPGRARARMRMAFAGADTWDVEVRTG